MVRAGVAALCLILVACVGFGSCTHCYQCTSTSDQGCADPFSSKSTLKDCTMIPNISKFNVESLFNLDGTLASHDASKQRHCYKIITGTNVTIRSCFDTDPGNVNATCNRLIANGGAGTDVSKQIKHCSVCNGENCNGAGAPIASIFLALASVMLAYFTCRQ